ncbi:MAG: hypothetical protein KatS3mg035_1818 [Bacteroidia bacterium]|nr:MAG: hypothetical protein KatS3mg035_1818 [Bacteroidia bacterium]
MNLKKHPQLLFLLIIFLLTLLIYNGTRHFVMLPYGIHQWRQSMNYSIIQNFQEPHTHFFKPAMDNLLNPDNTGYLILEFPIFQWLISFLPREYFPYFRWLIYLSSLSGLYFAFQWSYQILKNFYLALASILIIFFTPLFLFYNANYFVDLPAILWSISAVYFWKKATDENFSPKSMGIGTIFYTLAGLLRPVGLAMPFAFMIDYGVRNFKKNKILFFYFILSTSLIVIWYIYQQKNNPTYEVHTPPQTSIFYSSKEEIKNVLYAFRDFHFHQFGFIFGSIFPYIISFLIIGFHWKYYEKTLKNIFIWTSIGTWAYIILWFKVFQDHDYYLIPCLSFFFITSLMTLMALHHYLSTKSLYITISVILLFCFYHGYENYRLRDFRGWYGFNWNATKFEEGMFWWIHQEDQMIWSKIRDLSTHLDTLQKAGIQKKDTVICNFDTTPAYVLSLLQLKGWSLPNEKGTMNRFEQYQYYINRGAKYLIHYGNRTAVENDPQKDSLLKQKLVLQYDSIKFYKIDHLKN